MQPSSHAKITQRTREFSTKLARFGRDFAGGMNRKDLERMFDEDAVNAFSVLSGERLDTSGEDFQTFLRQVKGFFLGLAFKLTPARRLLFTASILLPVAGFVFGALEVKISRTLIHFDTSAFWFLTSICGLTLLLALELVDRLRVRDELDVARELQSELLPSSAPRPPGYEIVHSYRTANEIGGDYYDFLPLDDGRMVVTVGDASGHGIGAGLLMAIANATLKTAIELDPSPPAVLDLLNRTLCRTGGPRAFMTLFYSVLDATTGELVYACAGHPYPLLRRASGEIEELGEGAIPLGIRRETTYEEGRTTLEPGDVLVLYSDGLPELVDDDDQAFGFERLHRIVELPGDAQSVHDHLVADASRHLGSRRLADDLTLVVVCRHEKPNLPPLPPG